MAKKRKRAFTITELVIVIAVVAILAAVLIPTFANIINKANESADTQLVRNLNTALAASTEKHETMQSALDAAAESGFDVAKINAKVSENEILWDSENDVFCYYNDGKIEYVPDSASEPASEGEYYRLWTISDTIDSRFSTYYTGSDVTIETTKGFDAGKNMSILSISYSNSGSAQDVVIRTLGDECTLTVDAPNDTVSHYGFVKEVTVENISATDCYHEFGTASAMYLQEGAKKVVIENTGIVFNLKSKPAGVDFSNSGTIIASEVADVQGSGSYAIATPEKLAMFRDAVNAGTSFAGVTVELTADIALSGAWKPIGIGSREQSKSDLPYKGTAFKGIFDGQNHTISGLTNVGYDDFMTYFAQKHNAETFCYGLFGIVDGATIKNLNLTNVSINTESVTFEQNGAVKTAQGDSIGAIIGFSAGSLTLENCTVSGSVIGFDAVGGLIGRAYDQNNDGTVKTLRIANCTNNALVQGDIKVAGIVGYIGSTLKVAGTQQVTITGCTNNGRIVGNASADSYTFGIAGFGFNDPANTTLNMNYVITDNTNNGTIENTANRKMAAYIAGGCAHNANEGDSYTYSGNVSTVSQQLAGKDLVLVVATQTDITSTGYIEANGTSYPAN